MRSLDELTRHKSFGVSVVARSFVRFKLSLNPPSLHLAGDNKGAYAHPLFIKDRPELVEQIQRVGDLRMGQASRAIGVESTQVNGTLPPAKQS